MYNSFKVHPHPSLPQSSLGNYAHLKVSSIAINILELVSATQDLPSLPGKSQWAVSSPHSKALSGWGEMAINFMPRGSAPFYDHFSQLEKKNSFTQHLAVTEHFIIFIPPTPPPRILEMGYVREEYVSVLIHTVAHTDTHTHTRSYCLFCWVY